MTNVELHDFEKIVNFKSNDILELKKVIETLDNENSLGYHDVTIADLKNKSIFIEELIASLYIAKNKNSSLDSIRKMAYKDEKPPYITKKSPAILLDDYLQLLDSCERMTLDFIECKKHSRNKRSSF